MGNAIGRHRTDGTNRRVSERIAKLSDVRGQLRARRVGQRRAYRDVFVSRKHGRNCDGKQSVVDCRGGKDFIMPTYRFAPNVDNRVYDAGVVKDYLATKGIASEVSVFTPQDGRVEYVVESATDPTAALIGFVREDTAEEKAHKVLRNLFPKLRDGQSLTAAEQRQYLMALTVLVGM